jgi:pimeloyl-ACP methyl ester carboxylesterase
VVSGGDFSSDKPILCMVHGFPETWATWQSQLVYFARLGFPVAAFDMRGFGLSTAPAEPSAYSAKLLVADQLAVVRKLRSMCSDADDHDVVLITHDMGGVVGWQTAFTAAAARRDSGISKFVFAAAPHPAEFIRYSLFVDRFQLLRSWYMRWFQASTHTRIAVSKRSIKSSRTA